MKVHVQGNALGNEMNVWINNMNWLNESVNWSIKTHYARCPTPNWKLFLWKQVSVKLTHPIQQYKRLTMQFLRPDIYKMSERLQDSSRTYNRGCSSPKNKCYKQPLSGNLWFVCLCAKTTSWQVHCDFVSIKTSISPYKKSLQQNNEQNINHAKFL